MRFRFLALSLLAAFLFGPLFPHRASGDIAERVHTRYDAQLGWANIPGKAIPGMYGPGRDLRINSQGFRNDSDFSVRIPEGRTRVVCSGDSFTLGFGVDQPDSWCAQLASHDERVETVNMGQGGYGIDQSYLWYMRDGRRLDHDAHLFTFIYADFERMRAKDFFGYRKPELVLRGGDVLARDAEPPGPRHSRRLSPLTRFRIWLHRFESVQWLEEQARKRFLRVDDARVRETSSAIFRSLKCRNFEKQSSLIVVYLPTRMDREPTQLDDFRRWLAAELGRQGIRFADLTDSFRSLSEDSFEALFLKPGDVPLVGAEGHYSPEGNRFVARLLFREVADSLRRSVPS